MKCTGRSHCIQTKLKRKSTTENDDDDDSRGVSVENQRLENWRTMEMDNGQWTIVKSKGSEE